MVELLTDMTMLWVSVMFTVLLLTAFTKSNRVFIEWELFANWKRQDLQIKQEDPTKQLLIPPIMITFKPKIPSQRDHSQDDEAASPLVYS